MLTRFIAILISAVFVTPAFTAAQPQRLTIPQALARGWTGWISGEPSGQLPTISDIVADADLIVRGIVGTPTSYLSDDERDVYTDYPLSNPVIIHQSGVISSRQPGVFMVAVTQLGGTVTIGNLTFTHTTLGLLPLKVNSEGLFFLKRVGDKYHIVGRYFGAFGISDGTVVPLAGREDFAPEYRGVSISEASDNIAAHLQALHR